MATTRAGIAAAALFQGEEFVSVPFHGVYAASKHALAGYTEALRHEVRAFGIHVCLIEPAAHRTQIHIAHPRRLLREYDEARGQVEAIIQGQIDGGSGPERVAEVIVAAATSESPRARYRVGWKALLAVWAIRLMPARLFEHFVRREFRLQA